MQHDNTLKQIIERNLLAMAHELERDADADQREWMRQLQSLAGSPDRI